MRLGAAQCKLSPFLGCRQGAEVASREAGRASVEVAAAEEAATASQAKEMRIMRQPCEHLANLWTASQQVPPQPKFPRYDPYASITQVYITGLHGFWQLPC